MHPVNYEGIDFSHMTMDNLIDVSRLAICSVLSQIAVPVFFFISGYLFFNKLDKWNWNTYYSKLKKRIKTLLFPYLIWNGVSIILAILVLSWRGGWADVCTFVQSNGYFDLFWSCNSSGVNRINELGIPTPMTYPYLIPLWYLRELIVMVLLSPLFYLVFKKLRWGGIALLFLSFVLGIGLNIPGFLSLAFFFYGSGAFFSMNRMNPSSFFYRYRWIFYLITIVLLVIEMRYLNIRGVVYSLFIICGSISVINLSVTSLKRGFVISQMLTDTVFFIFLSHGLYITSITGSIMDKLFGTSNSIQLFFGYLLSPIVTIMICISLQFIIRKISPRLLTILTGGRI